MRFWRLGLVAAFLFSSVFLITRPMWAQTVPTSMSALAEGPGRVVMVVIDRMGLDDLDAAAFADTVAHSGLGLMNTNTGGMRNVENTHATIGAGSRIVATNAGFLAFDVREKMHRVPAGEEFERRTGVTAPEGSVVHLGIARIWSLSRNLPYPVEVGALGTTLRDNGLTTGIFGNADWDGMHRRAAAAIVMDNRGLVDRGMVGKETLTVDPQFPGRLRTDYEGLFEAFREYGDVDFLVIALGDLSRLDEAQNHVLPDVLAELRTRSVERSGEFVERLRQELDPERDLLLVVSPTPPAGNILAKNTLSPVLMIGPPGSGTITSYSTRREGIVTNMDLAPTVLGFFGITPPVEMVGRALTVLPGTPDLSGLQALNERLVLTHNMRVPVIRSYMTLQVLLVIVVVLAIIIRDLPIVRREHLQQLLLVSMSFPLAVLLLPLLPQPGPFWVGLGIILLTLGIGAIAVLIGRKHPFFAFVFLGGATVMVIVGDLLLGVFLLKISILSHDPLVGARFYGIGNEFMGVLIGAAIMTAAVSLSLVHRRYRITVLGMTGALFLVTLFTIANPNLGANMGGTITAVISFLVTMLLFLGVRFTRRLFLAGAGGVLVFLAGLTALEFFRGVEQQSHIGRAARLVFGGDLGTAVQEAYNIIHRKVSMNLRLLRHTIWSQVFLVSLGGLALLSYRPIGRMQTFRERYPYLFKGLVGIVVASVVALVFNDSGVVAAATVMILGVPPLLYFFLEDGS